MHSPKARKPTARGRVLRGGRLRKTARGILTYAPWLGIATALASAIAAATPATAAADKCPADPSAADTFLCSGAAAASSDTTQTFHIGGRPLTITDTEDFGIHVAEGDAFNILARLGKGLSVDLDGDIHAGLQGIYAVHRGTGASRLTANGDIDAGSGGIEMHARGTGASHITANGDIAAGWDGIFAHHVGYGAVEINAAGAIDAARNGIQVYQESLLRNNASYINADTIDAGWDGIRVFYSGGGRGGGGFRITANGDITAALSGIVGEFVGANSVGIDINPGVTVTGGNGTAIQVTGAASINLDSATLVGGIQAEDGIVTVKGLSAITGTSDIASLRNIEGALSLDNGNTADRITAGQYVGGGTLTMNATFAPGDDTADILTLTGAVSGGAATTVNLVAAGNVADLDEDGLTLVTQAAGGQAQNSFTLGSVTLNGASVERHGLSLDYDPSGHWRLTAATHTSPAVAPGCRGSSGVFVCAGAITTPQSLAVGAGEVLVLADEDDTSFEIAAGDALTILAAADSGSMGIIIDAAITAAGTDAEAGDGIRIRRENGTQTGLMSVTANGDIAAGKRGIYVLNDDANGGDITITAGGDIAAGRTGIYASQYRGGDGDITITANGDITSGGAAISAHHSDAAGKVEVRVAATVENDGAFNPNAAAISMNGGGSQRLILEPGADIGAPVGGDGGAVFASRSDATLELAAAQDESARFDLNQLADWSRFATLEKSGAGAWTLAGNTSDATGFAATRITEGILRLENAILNAPGTAPGTLDIAAAATLQASGANAIDARLANTGAIDMTANPASNDRLVVEGFAAGGTLALNVDFTAATADQLHITGETTRAAAASTAVTLVTAGDIASLTGGLLLVGASGPDAGSDDDFTLASVTGAALSDLVLRRDPTTGDWFLRAAAPLSPPTPGCSETANGVACAGDITERQTLSASAGAFTLTDDPGASFTVAAGDALQLFGERGATGITAAIDADITAAGAGDQAGNGIFARHEGTGTIDLTANGDISAADNGIRARHQHEGDISVTATGTITTARNGIYARHRGDDGDITVAVTGEIDIERKGVEARHRSTGDITVRTAAGSAVTSNWKGLEARHRGGSGDITITAAGAITADWKGIETRIVRGNGDIDITAAGTITGGRKGIEARHHGTGEIDIDIEKSGAIRDSRRGIEARHRGTGDITITTAGRIDAHNLGIYAQHTGTGNVSITVPPDAQITGERKNGIRVSANENSSIEVDIAGSVSGKQSLFLRGGTSQKLTLRPGFALEGQAKGEGATLELADVPEGAEAADGALNFNAVTFASFTDFMKSGNGAWQLTGTIDSAESFAAADITAGTLRFSDANFAMTSEGVLTVEENGTLELQGGNILDGTLANRGAISFAENSPDASLTILGNWTGDGGTLTLNVDFDGGTANRLIVQGNATGTTTVSLRANGGEVGDKSAEVIRVLGTAASNAFTGEGTAGPLLYRLEADGTGGWKFRITGRASRVSTAEAYAGALAALSQPPSTMERLGTDYWQGGSGGKNRSGGQGEGGNGGGVGVGGSVGVGKNRGGGRGQGGNWDGDASLVADVSSESSRFSVNGIRSDMNENRVRAGVLVPVGNILLGAEMWQGAAQSLVSSTGGKGKRIGEIDIASHAAALSATWLAPNGFYADAQTQYARFTGNITADRTPLAAKHNANGIAASTELGWRLNAPAPAGLDTLQLAPQAQLTWSRIAFADFTAPDNLRISLTDGATATARLSLAWRGEWHNPNAGTGRIHGGLNLHEPLDSTTTLNISGTPFPTDHPAPTLNATLGFGHEWVEGYSLEVEAAASRRDGVGEYDVNLGVRIEF